MRGVSKQVIVGDEVRYGMEFSLGELHMLSHFLNIQSLASLPMAEILSLAIYGKYIELQA
jgi:hypothetical protein